MARTESAGHESMQAAVGLGHTLPRDRTATPHAAPTHVWICARTEEWIHERGSLTCELRHLSHL